MKRLQDRIVQSCLGVDPFADRPATVADEMRIAIDPFGPFGEMRSIFQRVDLGLFELRLSAAVFVDRQTALGLVAGFAR